MVLAMNQMQQQLQRQQRLEIDRSLLSLYISAGLAWKLCTSVFIYDTQWQILPEGGRKNRALSSRL